MSNSDLNQSDFTAAEITRPDPVLLKYYAIRSVFAGPFFPIALVPQWIRYSTLMVSTAGGGGGATADASHGASLLGSHVGLIEGVANAKEIRELIMNRLNASRCAGLGDEDLSMLVSSRSDSETPIARSPEHLAVLEEIRDLTAKLAS